MAEYQVSASDSATANEHPGGSYGIPVAVAASDTGVMFDYMTGGVGGASATTATFTGTASCALYLGRYRRGDKVPLYLQLGSTPDAPPIAIVMDSNNDTIATIAIPATDQARTLFQIPLFIGLSYALGSFTVYFHYLIAGTASLQQAKFDVIAGGDSGGGVVSLYSLDRIEARCLVAQLSSGVLVLGKSPTVQA